MADRSLKGTGLGAKSFEDEAGVEFAPRQEVTLRLPAAAPVQPSVRGRGRDPVAVGVPTLRGGVVAFGR